MWPTHEMKGQPYQWLHEYNYKYLKKHVQLTKQDKVIEISLLKYIVKIDYSMVIRIYII